MVSFLDPTSVHKPGPAYSHSAVVPAGTELVFLSGQVGVRPDGSTSAAVAEQAEQVFANISAILEAHGLGTSALVKLTTFLVAGQDIQAVRAARSRFLGAHRRRRRWSVSRNSPIPRGTSRWRRSRRDRPRRRTRAAFTAPSRKHDPYKPHATRMRLYSATSGFSLT
ncbi:MAG TPA: RidA family protein [Caldimonas sp.]|jgi:enamine deaminase RidA (YjgF/YER057c/UK114 family)|nr:RidA family protein [Caldimonas sp.]HEX2541162.1 RidA family protein [Caldimonas sp.]